MQIILLYYSTKIQYFEIRTQNVGEMGTLERINMLRQLIKMFQRANFKAGTHEATNRSNILLQQIALCVQSSDKSYPLIAAIGCSDKSPGVNASTFGGRLLIRILSPQQNLVAATCRTKSNQFDFVQHVAATKFCRGEKIFDKTLLSTQ